MSDVKPEYPVYLLELSGMEFVEMSEEEMIQIPPPPKRAHFVLRPKEEADE